MANELRHFYVTQLYHTVILRAKLQAHFRILLKTCNYDTEFKEGKRFNLIIHMSKTILSNNLTGKNSWFQALCQHLKTNQLINTNLNLIVI